LISSFGDVKWKHVENEIRAIAKLCVHRHENIVQVFEHGKVPGFPYYFIDMELCDVDLSAYIDGKGAGTLLAKRIFGMDRALSEGMTATWEILKDITDGLIFIHELKEIHRDMKPRNGITVCLAS
jgi:serine/threonine protein kinase